jgi:hypothetical protein
MNLCFLHASFTSNGQYSIVEVATMKGFFFAACILSGALVGIGSANGSVSSAEEGDHYTRAQLKQLARDAHTPEQYRTLAGYYEKQHKDYLQQAAEEKQEWVRRGQNVMGAAAKYPRPSDSARNLYEYYVEKATKAGLLSAKYTQMAEQAAPPKIQ